LILFLDVAKGLLARREVQLHGVHDPAFDPCGGRFGTDAIRREFDFCMRFEPSAYRNDAQIARQNHVLIFPVRTGGELEANGGLPRLEIEAVRTTSLLL
jgi:hypothetical protein